MKAMILAAGEGTRLRPLTLDRPKPMLPVAGRPLLEHIIAWLRHHHITRIAMNLHHRPQIVMDHFGRGVDFGVDITYSIEDEILGTAGGAKRLAPFLDEPFVLVYGDVLTDFDLSALIEFHRSRPPEPHLSIALYRVPNPWDCGIVGLDGEGRILRFVEKPKREDVFSDLASTGVLVVDHELLQYVPAGRFSDFGLDILPALLRSGVPLHGWTIPDSAYLVDVGSPERYARVQREWPTAAARTFVPAGGDR
ncbi:MAG TPA: nucleotidyltransferase family protein [Methylomirabilota bacterium]|jgi:NDP-sugar pyrophosphorylase family protein